MLGPRSLCLLSHLFYPTLLYFPKVIFFEPPLYFSCSNLCLLPQRPPAHHAWWHLLPEDKMCPGWKRNEKGESPLTSDPTACTPIPNSTCIPHRVPSQSACTCICACVDAHAWARVPTRLCVHACACVWVCGSACTCTHCFHHSSSCSVRCECPFQN